MAEDNALYNCQPNTSTLKRVGTVESLKDAEEFIDILHIKTYAVIFHIVDALIVGAIVPDFHAGFRLVP